jgi:ATP:ADP antiporter, AAA family
LVGLRRCLGSPYLLAICGFLLLYTASSTVIYLERQDIVAATIDGRSGWRAFSAKLDIYTQSLALIGQLLVTSALLKRLGIAGGLAFVPAVTMLGFGVLGGWSTLLVVGIVETCRKVCEYVVTRPSREVLYTVVPREEKYEAKVFIDTFVYRLGDVLGTGFVSCVAIFSAQPGATFLAAIPFLLVWIVVAVQLGRKQAMMQRELAHRESSAVVAAN